MWRGVVVLIEGNGTAWHGLAWSIMAHPVLVVGRWGLVIKGEFVTVDHGVVISRAPTYPL